MEMPASRSPRIASNKVLISSAPRTAVGSSKTTNLALPSMRARAICTSLRWATVRSRIRVRPSISTPSVSARNASDCLCIFRDSSPSSPPPLLGHEHRFGYIEVRDQAELLVNEAHPLLVHGCWGHLLEFGAFHRDGAAVGFIDPRQHFDDGRLAGPVLAHKAVDLSGKDCQAGPVERLHSRKRLGDVAHQQGI